jgi:cell division protein FtsW
MGRRAIGRLRRTADTRRTSGRRAAGRRPAGPPPLEYRMLLTATLCLLAGGAVMVYSASSARDLLAGHGNGTAYLERYVLYAALGLVLMRVLARRGVALVARLVPVLLLVGLAALVAVLVPGIGVEVNGARRWLGAGPLQFEPSELVKLALVLYAVQLFATQPRRARSVRGVVNPLVVVAGVAGLLVMAQPDLGTALVIAFSLAAVLIAAGVPLRTLALLAAAGALLLVLFAVAEPYRRARLTSFVDPWAHAGSTGFQAVQGQIALGSGGLFGVGLGRSVQKIFYLPEAHTDFILAVIGEELGIAGICGVLFLYGMLAWAGMRAAQRAAAPYAKLLAAGITSLILSQATLNVFAVLGLAPLTGVPLPFISYGSSNLVVLLAAMGLLLNVAGGRAQLRVVAPRASPRTSSRTSLDAADSRDRRRRDRRARGARAGGRRRAAG